MKNFRARLGLLLWLSALASANCGGQSTGPSDGSDARPTQDAIGVDVVSLDGSDVPATDVPVSDVPGVDVVKDVPIDDVPGDEPDATPVDVIAIDVQPDVVVDTGLDIPTDGPWDPCAAGAIVDLSVSGTVSGPTTTYNGDSSAIPTDPVATGMACAAGRAAHVVALRYTTRTQSRLIVSTFHAGTAADFDTIVWAQSSCNLAGGPSYGCNDDVPGADQTRTPAPSGSSLRDSIFTTANTSSPDLTFPAGTTVYIFVGGFHPPSGSTSLEMGPFQLTVTEVTPPSAAGGPCEPASPVTLCAMGATCSATGTDYSQYSCNVPGTLGAACRTTAPQCDPGLGCDRSNVCVTGVPIGGACDPTGALNTCVVGSHCITGAGASYCIADGTSGGRCRTGSPQCDSGLACNGANVCVTSVAIGGICDPSGAMNTCVSGSHCITQGASSTCVADGTNGGYCRTSGTACDSPYMCTGSPTSPTSRCLTIVSAGGTCDPTLVTSRCAAGLVCVPGSGGTGTCAAHAYTTGASTASWIDACAATGATTALSGSDDNNTALTLPFAIPFFGVNYPAGAITTVSTNGWMSFTSGAPTVYTPSTFPIARPDNAAYVMFMDLFFRAGTPTPQLCYATTGTAPNRTLVVEWFHDGYFTSMAMGDYVTFEVQFHEGSGGFDYLYNGSMGTEYVNTASIGAESTGGTSFTSVCAGNTAPNGCTTASLTNMHFTPMP